MHWVNMALKIAQPPPASSPVNLLQAWKEEPEAETQNTDGRQKCSKASRHSAPSSYQHDQLPRSDPQHQLLPTSSHNHLHRCKVSDSLTQSLVETIEHFSSDRRRRSISLGELLLLSCLSVTEEVKTWTAANKTQRPCKPHGTRQWRPWAEFNVFCSYDGKRSVPVPVTQGWQTDCNLLVS